MWHRIKWGINRIRQTLWFRPLAFTTLAVGAVLVAGSADRFLASDALPDVNAETLEDLLAIIATSMLSVATFAVASMVAAYASAGSTATPRAFALIVTDDVSRTALSGFIGAFIFSIVALTAVKTGTLGRPGLSIVFALTILTFAVVIMLFLRWVDRIARLGRLGTTIRRVEDAAERAIRERRRHPCLGGVAATDDAPAGRPVLARDIGYVQSIALDAIQQWASGAGLEVQIDAVPGTFVGPGRSLATVRGGAAAPAPEEADDPLRRAFIIGDERTFEEDPRFGLVVLAEIAARALSPAVNDPGTAIDITGRFVRLFAVWAADGPAPEIRFDRVHVPRLDTMEMFDDAFTAIARDGAGFVEVGIRLQKAFIALAATGHPEVRAAAVRHSGLAMARAAPALLLPEEKSRLEALAAAVSRAAAADPRRD